MLKNLDADGLANICTQLAEAYDSVSGDDEALQNYVDQFANVWAQLGLNNYVNLNGLINKNKISQAVNKLLDVTAVGISNYYAGILGTNITFDDKTILYETPRRDVAEVDGDAILTIKSEPRTASDASVSINVAPIYDGNMQGLTVFKTFTEQDQILDVQLTSDIEIGSVYFVGLGFGDGVTKSSLAGQLVSILNVNIERLVLTAQALTNADKTALLATANNLTQSELDNAVNLNIIVDTIGNNIESNPTPLVSEMKNINLVQKVTSSSAEPISVLPLNIIADNTTLGDTNKIWIITANRRIDTTNNERLTLELSLTQEIKVSDLQAPDIDANGQIVVNPEPSGDCVNTNRLKPSDNTIAEKTSTIQDLAFEIKIQKPSNMQYRRNVNIEFTKYDDGRNKDIGTPVSMTSLMTTYNESNPYIPEQYTYGKIVYLVDNTSKSIVNTTDSGVLLYSYASIEDPDDIRYGYIEPMGAGTITITPCLVMTERDENGVEYAIRYDDAEGRYVRVDLSEANESTLDIIDRYNTITVKVTERIVSLTYYLSVGGDLGPECPKNDPDTYFATGANNAISMYVRPNSALAFPASDTEYQGLGYTYGYRVTANGEQTTDLNISYPDTGRFVTLQITMGEDQLSINCMAIEIMINPLRSLDPCVYTITWYKDNTEIQNSQIYINAKDYFATPDSLSFDEVDKQTQKSKSYTAKLVVDENNSNIYWIKWNADDADNDYFELPDVHYLATNNDSGTLPYIQSSIYPSVTSISTVFYWIKDPAYDDEETTYTYAPITTYNAYFVLTETTTNADLTIKSLYLKKELLKDALGVRVGYRYNPGVDTGTVVECDYDIFLNWPVLEYAVPDGFTVAGAENNILKVTLPSLHAYTNTLLDKNVTLNVANDTIVVPAASSSKYSVGDIIRIYEGSTPLITNANITAIDNSGTNCIITLMANTLSNVELNANKQYHIYKLTDDVTYIENNKLIPTYTIGTAGITTNSTINVDIESELIITSVDLTTLNSITFNRSLVLRARVPTSGGGGYSEITAYQNSLTVTKQTT